jgi:non-canonical purine NTP pyrophosphatase (RdgB/HAM1 family)
MLSIYFLTSNDGKIKSMRRLVEPLGIKVYIRRPTGDQPERKDDSLEAITKFKVLDNKDKMKANFVVQDSGFYLTAKPGFPGPNVNHVLSTIGIEGILNMLSQEKRSCYFKNVLAFWSPRLQEINPKNSIIYFSSELHGNVTPQASEVNSKYAWSDLWKIFIPNGHKIPLSEMTRKELDKFHESQNTSEDNAFMQLADWLKKNINSLYVQTSLFDD